MFEVGKFYQHVYKENKSVKCVFVSENGIPVFQITETKDIFLPLFPDDYKETSENG